MEGEEAFDEKYLASILERNPHLLKNLKIHPWRWRFIAIWIVVFTILVFVSIRQNRSAISQLNRNKASLVSLEKTNCALRSFLFAAYAVRIKTARDQHADPSARAAARSAAQGYYKLYVLFPQDGCKHALRGGKR